LASESGSSGNGFFRRKRKVRSSTAATSSVAAMSAWPKASRCPQRRTEAAQSRARTGSPSWNRSSSRKRMFQTRPSFSTVCPSAICGRAQLAVPAVERVVDHQRVVAGDEGHAVDRVQQREVGLRNEAQRAPPGRALRGR
jgi:hypothetical protein